MQAGGQAGKRVWYGLAARCREDSKSALNVGARQSQHQRAADSRIEAPLSKMAVTGRAEAQP